MKVIVDRFEGDLAVCEKEDKSMVDIPKKELPKEVQPGDVVIIEDGKSRIEKGETQERKHRIEKLANDLWE
jgi:pyruvate kinase